MKCRDLSLAFALALVYIPLRLHTRAALEQLPFHNKRLSSSGKASDSHKTYKFLLKNYDFLENLKVPVDFSEFRELFHS